MRERRNANSRFARRSSVRPGSGADGHAIGVSLLSRARRGGAVTAWRFSVRMD